MAPNHDCKDSDAEDKKRASRRRRVFKQGLAQADASASAVACLVRDLSEIGARLKFDTVALVPRTFILHIPVDGVQWTCERRWVRGRECGVLFTSEPRPSALAKQQIIRSIEAEGAPEAEAAPGSANDPVSAPQGPTAPKDPPQAGRRQTPFGRRQ